MPQIRNLYYGTTYIKQPCLGTTNLKAVYFGSDLIWGDVTNRIYVLDSRDYGQASHFSCPDLTKSNIGYNVFSGGTLSQSTLNSFSNSYTLTQAVVDYINSNTSISSPTTISSYNAAQDARGFIICYYGQYSPSMRIPNDLTKCCYLVKDPPVNTTSSERKFTYTKFFFDNLSLVEGNHKIFYLTQTWERFYIPYCYLKIFKGNYANPAFKVYAYNFAIKNYDNYLVSLTNTNISGTSKGTKLTGTTIASNSLCTYNFAARVRISMTLYTYNYTQSRPFYAYFALYTDTSCTDLCSNRYSVSKSSMPTAYAWNVTFSLDVTKPVNTYAYLGIYCDDNNIAGNITGADLIS